MSGPLTGFSDPAGCLGTRTLGETTSNTWAIYVDGSSLLIQAGDPDSDFPVYRGSLNGLQIDLVYPEPGVTLASGGDGACTATFGSSLVGSFSADRRQLDVVETWIWRYSSGVESTLAWHMTGSRVR